MPIRPENKARYPKNWKEIERVRARSKDRCEFRLDKFNQVYSEKSEKVATKRCTAKNGQPHPLTASTVVLTVAHLNHQPEDNRDENLLHGCQRCHNIYDMPMRRAGILSRARKESAVGDLFQEGPKA